jgi:hypothetical protein
MALFAPLEQAEGQSLLQIRKYAFSIEFRRLAAPAFKDLNVHSRLCRNS